jgi:hypothetical protein
MRGIQARMSSPLRPPGGRLRQLEKWASRPASLFCRRTYRRNNDWSICIQLVGNRSRSVNDLNQAHENARRKHRRRVLGLEHKNS